MSFGKRGAEVTPAPKGFGKMSDGDVIGRFYMADKELKEALTDWGEIMRGGERPEHKQRIATLDQQIRYRIDVLTNSKRGSSIKDEELRKYIWEKLVVG